MPENQIESQTTDPTASTNEELLTAKEEIEFLRNLVESQNSYICHLEKKLLEVNQELEITNKELGMSLMLGVCFDEALIIAKTILKEEKSGSKIVANLLNFIYGSLVKPEELTEIESKYIIKTDAVKTDIVNKVVAQSIEIRVNSQYLHTRYKELGYRFVAFKAQMNHFRAQWTNFAKTPINTQDENNPSPPNPISPLKGRNRACISCTVSQ